MEVKEGEEEGRREESERVVSWRTIPWPELDSHFLGTKLPF